MLNFSQYLILADIEGFFGIVFFLIAFVGWVINLVNQNQEQKKPPRRRPPNQAGQRRKKAVQNEIDQFLGQARRNSGQRPATDVDDVEVIAPPSERRAPPRRRRTREEVWEKQTGAAPSKKPKPASPSQKPKGRGLASRHLETRESQAKKSAEKPRTPKPISSIAKNVENDLPHAVDASVAAHLSKFTAESPTSAGQIGIARTTTNRRTKGSVLGKLLQSKESVRNAVILNEVLSPPKSMRK